MTGGASGIGLATVTRLAEPGAGGLEPGPNAPIPRAVAARWLSCVGISRRNEQAGAGKPGFTALANDPLEREANHVAEQVTRRPDPETSSLSAPPPISRKSAACDEAEKLDGKAGTND